MALENFVAYKTIFESNILKEREANLVFVKYCQRVDGYGLESGATVTFKKLGGVPVHTLSLDGVYDTYSGKDKLQYALGTPDSFTDGTVSLQIKEAAYFNFTLGDIDKEFAKEAGKSDVVAELERKIGRELALGEDKYVRDLILAEPGAKFTTGANGTSGAWKITSEKNVSGKIFAPKVVNKVGTAFQEIEVHDLGEVISLTSPSAMGCLRESLTNFYTSNNEQIASQHIGNIDGIDFVSSTLCTVGGKHYMFFMTKNKAVAYAEGDLKTEALVSQQGFNHIYRGYKIFGAKVIFPKEVMYLELEEID